MSTKRHIGIVCDAQGEGCLGSTATCSESAREARAMAADEGWFRQGERDICPACVAPAAPAPPARDRIEE